MGSPSSTFAMTVGARSSMPRGSPCAVSERTRTGRSMPRASAHRGAQCAFGTSTRSDAWCITCPSMRRDVGTWYSRTSQHGPRV
eukprot:12271821-Alexandrium_andersonii.AAC.1